MNTMNIEQATTRQFKAIFPGTLNANDSLFGGLAMKWMDEVAYITATRFTRQRMFTVSTDKIRFLNPVKPDSIIEIVGTIEKVGGVKLFVKTEIFAEEMYSQKRFKAVEGHFVLAALSVDEKVEPLSVSQMDES